LLADRKQHYDRKIAALEAELESAKAIRAALDNPAMVAELESLFGGKSSGNGKTAQPKKSGHGALTNYDKVVAVFRANGNAFLRVPELAKASKISRGNLSNVIYTSQRTNFDMQNHPEFPRQKLVRMKPEHLNS
jgi:hypothetical protein